MSTGICGAPITLDTLISDAKLLGINRHPEHVTQITFAKWAMEAMSLREKDAIKYVEDLKSNYGKGVSTRCMIYNATGTTLELVTSKDYHGKLFEYPYPRKIMNGQWGVFLHAHPRFGTGYGSAGAVIYRSLLPENNEKYCDWAYSWLDPYAKGSNRVYASIREREYFSREETHWDRYHPLMTNFYGDESHWDRFYPLLENAKSSSEDRNYGYLSEIKIDQGSSVVVRGVFSMPS